MLLTIHGHVTASAMSHGHDVFRSQQGEVADSLPVLEAQKPGVRADLLFSVRSPHAVICRDRFPERGSNFPKLPSAELVKLGKNLHPFLPNTKLFNILTPSVPEHKLWVRRSEFILGSAFPSWMILSKLLNLSALCASVSVLFCF